MSQANSLYQQLRGHLSYLKLGAAAEQLAPALEAAERAKPGYTRFLHDLLAVEVEATEQRKLDGRRRFSKLPARKTLEQFDLDANPRWTRPSCAISEPSGSWKTHPTCC